MDFAEEFNKIKLPTIEELKKIASEELLEEQKRQEAYAQEQKLLEDNKEELIKQLKIKTFNTVLNNINTYIKENAISILNGIVCNYDYDVEWKEINIVGEALKNVEKYMNELSENYSMKVGKFIDEEYSDDNKRHYYIIFIHCKKNKRMKTK